MTTIEIKMHYTVTSIFKFTKVAINKYLLLPIILFFYALFSISNVILFSHNFLVNIVVIFILAKIASYIDSFIISIVINKMLKNNYEHTFIFNNEKIVHIDNNGSKEYHYKDFKTVLFPKNYIYFKRKRFLLFFVNINLLSDNEKKHLINCIKGARNHK